MIYDGAKVMNTKVFSVVNYLYEWYFVLVLIWT